MPDYLNNLISAIIAGVVALSVAWMNHRSNRDTATTPTYDAMVKRLEAVEGREIIHTDQIYELMRERDKQNAELREAIEDNERQEQLLSDLIMRVRLLEEREKLWQAAWDDLRHNWGVVRLNMEPPPYPTKLI
jgi:hypothetical protein